MWRSKKGSRIDINALIKYINMLDIKPNEKSIDSLKYILNEPIWTYRNQHITPQMVLDDPKKYKGHYDRILKADYYPIIIYKGTVIDGYHRLARSILLGQKKIEAYNITKSVYDRFKI